MSHITITQNVADVVPYLGRGRVIAFPTGTSYGFAADALQGWALQRLRNLKARPTEKTFTVFAAPKLWPTFFALTEQEERLLSQFANKPLTLLVRPTKALVHLAQDGLVGVRVIDHPLMQQLAEAVDVPLTATSANRAGQPPCYSTQQIEEVFKNPLPDEILNEDDPRGASGTTYDLALAAILDGGTLPERPATTIAKVHSNQIRIVREGALSLTELSQN